MSIPGESSNKLVISQIGNKVQVLLSDIRTFNEHLHDIIMNNKEKQILIRLLIQAKQLFEVYNQAVLLFYLEILTENTPNKQKDTISITETLRYIEDNLKSSEAVQEMFQNLTKGSKILTKRYNTQIKSKSVPKLIERKLLQIDEICSQKHLFQYLLNLISFPYIDDEGHSTKTKYNSIQAFKQYLWKINVNTQLPIRPQVHNTLVQKHSFISSFKKQKTFQGTISHKDAYIHSFNLPFQVEITFSKLLDYQKEVRLAGRKKYQGVKNVPRCSVRKPGIGALVGFDMTQPCFFCSPQQIEIPYSGLQQYDQVYVKKGSVQYQKTQIIHMEAKFIKEQDYIVDIPYNEKVKIQKDIETFCPSHHRCQCNELAEIAKSAKKAYDDINFYLQLIDLQRRFCSAVGLQLEDFQKVFSMKDQKNQALNSIYKSSNKAGTPQPTPTDNGEQEKTPKEITPMDEPTPKPLKQAVSSKQNSKKIKTSANIIEECRLNLSNFNLEGFNILNSQISNSNLSQLIHNQLTQSISFSTPIYGKASFTIQQQYQHRVHFQGSQIYTGTLSHSGAAYYREPYQFHKDLQITGKVSVLNCYEDCWFCSIREKEEDCQGSVHLYRKGIVQGTQPFYEVKKWQKIVNFSQDIEFTKEIVTDITVNYAEQCKVQCQKNKKVGFGHHSCSSCALLQIYITSFLSLLKYRQKLSNLIQKNQFLILQNVNSN